MNILLVDDDKDCRQSLAEFLNELGHCVTQCSGGISAIIEFQANDYHMIISDLRMPEMTGLELLHQIGVLPGGQDVDVVLCTAYGDMESSVAALRQGAYDYIQKPVNIEELISIVERVADHQALLRDNKRLTVEFNQAVNAATEDVQQELITLKNALLKIRGLDQMEVHSRIMKDIMQKARLLHKDRSIPVLIEGETGTGKELIAKFIHYGEKNSADPFVDINCAAINPGLFESELFGYEPGAFTGGAIKGSKGKMDIAKGGTLFLDEVSEIPVEIQAKLLRVIQEKEFYRVGGLRKIQCNVRFICATNRDLDESIARGEFRRDLFYRLNVVRIKVPPLRERKTDIIPLAHRFITRLAEEKNKKFQGISEQAKTILLNQYWPGNVRELRNVMEWVSLMYDDNEVQPYHLNILKSTPAREPLAQTCDREFVNVIDCNNFELPHDKLPLEEYTCNIIQQALKMHGGNKTETAKYLGISRRSIYSRLDRKKPM